MLSPSSLELLYQPLPPWMLLHPLGGDNIDFSPVELYSRQDMKAEIRKLRGQKMCTFQDLMDEFGAALQFFDGFGENVAALTECLRELDEYIQLTDSYVLIITNALNLLRDDPEDLPWFFRMMNRVGEWWATPQNRGSRYDRPAIPFHVVMQCRTKEIEEAIRVFGELPLLHNAG